VGFHIPYPSALRSPGANEATQEEDIAHALARARRLSLAIARVTPLSSCSQRTLVPVAHVWCKMEGSQMLTRSVTRWVAAMGAAAIACCLLAPMVAQAQT